MDCHGLSTDTDFNLLNLKYFIQNFETQFLTFIELQFAEQKKLVHSFEFKTTLCLSQLSKSFFILFLQLFCNNVAIRTSPIAINLLLSPTRLANIEEHLVALLKVIPCAVLTPIEPTILIEVTVL